MREMREIEEKRERESKQKQSNIERKEEQASDKIKIEFFCGCSFGF